MEQPYLEGTIQRDGIIPGDTIPGEMPLFTSPLENAFKILSGYVTGQEERRATKQAQDAQQITAGISAGSYKNSPAWYKQQDGSYVEPGDRPESIIAGKNAITAQYKALQDWSQYHDGTPPSYLTAGLPGDPSGGVVGARPSAAAGTLPGQSKTKAQKIDAMHNEILKDSNDKQKFKQLAATDDGLRFLVKVVRDKHPEMTESEALEAVKTIAARV